MEAKGKVCAVQVVVNGLRQADHIQSFFRKKVGCLVRAVAAQGDQAVQLQILVGFLHRGDFVHIIIADDAHVAEGRAGCAENGTAQGQNAGKLIPGHDLIVAFDQPSVSVMNANDLGIKHFISGTGYAPNGRIQAGTVSAAGQNTDSFFHKKTPPPLDSDTQQFYYSMWEHN